MAGKSGKVTEQDVANARNLTAETQALFKAQDQAQKAAAAYTALSEKLLASKKKISPFDHQAHKTNRDLAKVLESQLSTEEKLAAVQQAQIDYVKSQNEMGEKVSQSYLKQLKSLEMQVGAMNKIEKGNEAYQSAMDSINESVQEQMGAIGEIGQALKDGGPWAAVAVVAAMVVKEAIAIGKETKKLSKDLGVSVGQGTKLAGQMTVASTKAKLYGGSVEDVSAAMEALAGQSGSLNNLTQEAIDNTTKLSVRYGLGADNAAKLNKVLQEVTDGTQEGAEEMQNYAISMAKANDVAPSQVLGDIAENTEMFARYGAEGAKEFIKTSIAAKKLGIEMSSISAAANSMLQIEDSLAKQMEAEVLLGRQLNLDGARRAAMQGDYLTLTKELANQVGSVAEFNSMNAIQQQALADSLGMSVADTRKMVENKDKLAGLSEKELEHYKETGEIKEEGEKMDTMTKLTILAQGMGMLANIGHLTTMLGLRKANEQSAQNTKEHDGGGGEGGGGGLMEKMGKIDMKSVLKGALAMIIVAAAVFIFAKAVQEFMGVSWEAVGMAVVSMLALVGAVALLGLFMTSGGAVAIVMGALAMLIVAAAVLVLAVALKIMSEAIPAFMLLIPLLPELAIGMMMLYPAIPAFFLMGLALIPFGYGLLMASIGLLVWSAVGGNEILLSMAEAITTLTPLLLPFAAGMAALGLVSPLMAFIGLAMIPLGFGLLLASPGIYLFTQAIGDGSGWLAFGEALALIAPNILPFVAAMWLMVPLSWFTGWIAGAMIDIGEGFAASAVGMGMFVNAGGTEALIQMGASMSIMAPITGQIGELGGALKSFGKGMIVFGLGMGLAALGIGLFALVGGAETIASLAESFTALVPLTSGISALGSAFMSLAGGVAVLALSLLLLTPALPALLALGWAMSIESMMGGGAEDGAEAEGGGEQDKLIEKLDELITVVKQGGTVTLDGKKVGEVLTLAKAPLGA